MGTLNPRRHHGVADYLESDRDYVLNNLELCVTLLDTMHSATEVTKTGSTLDNPKLERWMADAIEKELPGFTPERYRTAVNRAHSAWSRFWASHPGAGSPTYIRYPEEAEPDGNDQ